MDCVRKGGEKVLKRTGAVICEPCVRIVEEEGVDLREKGYVDGGS